MILKSTVLALAAVAALGTTMLTSTTPAEAGFHGGHRGGHVRHAGHFRHPGFHGHRHRHFHGHYRHYRHVYYAPRPVVYAAAPVITTNRCTCLTKEYTPEGAVLFKDLCTNEAAINPPPAPLQTGMYQPGPQTAPQQ